MKDYNRDNVTDARELRRNMTLWERKLWHVFLKQYPIRFQRQKLLGNYIADFYCAKAKLVVELDGGGHYTDSKQAVDMQRTKFLESTGLQVLRFCNLDIDRTFSGVCEMIDHTVQQSLPQSACSADSPLLRGGQEGR